MGNDFRKWINVTLAGFALLAPCFSLQAAGQLGRGDVVVIPVRGEISAPLHLFLRRGIKLAETSGASAIILDMNTYGGRLDAAEQITSVLNRVSLPTYTFINTNAGSAGALIALATKNIYMAPVSAIGAAAPVLAGGQDLPSTERDKTISYWSALIRGMATRNGHNPDVGEAFMNKDKEVKIGDRVVHARGSLLSLNAQEATELIGGKSLLAAGVANDVEELARKAKLGGHISYLRSTGFEQLAFWITTLAPLLLLLGIVCAYLEFKMAGATLPGVVSALCFALFFLGHYLAGLAGWEAAVLFAIGVALILAEVLFFAHSTIVVGVIGLLLVFASLVWAMLDRYPDQPLIPSSGMLLLPLVNLSIALLTSIAAITLLARYLPRTSLYGRFALATSNPSGPSFTPENAGFSPRHAIAVGEQGIAITTLRPSGKARFGHRLVDVVTAGEFVTAESPVMITEIDGMRVLVARAPVQVTATQNS